MKMFHLILLSFSLILVSCKDDKAIRRHRDLSFLLGLFEMGFFKPNYCSPPQLLLEEGKTYNITLEAGKRFWFDYSLSSLDKNTSKKLRLRVNMVTGTTFNYDVINCSSSIESQASLPVPVSSMSNEIVYEFSANYNISNGFTDFLLFKSGDPKVIIGFELF